MPQLDSAHSDLLMDVRNLKSGGQVTLAQLLSQLYAIGDCGTYGMAYRDFQNGLCSNALYAQLPFVAHTLVEMALSSCGSCFLPSASHYYLQQLQQCWLSGDMVHSGVLLSNDQSLKIRSHLLIGLMRKHNIK